MDIFNTLTLPSGAFILTLYKAPLILSMIFVLPAVIARIFKKQEWSQNFMLNGLMIWNIFKCIAYFFVASLAFNLASPSTAARTFGLLFVPKEMQLSTLIVGVLALIEATSIVLQAIPKLLDMFAQIISASRSLKEAKIEAEAEYKKRLINIKKSKLFFGAGLSSSTKALSQTKESNPSYKTDPSTRQPSEVNQ